MSSNSQNGVPERPHQELQLQLAGVPLAWSAILCSRGALRGLAKSILDERASTKEDVLLRLRAGLSLSSTTASRHHDIVELLWDHDGNSAFQGVRSAVQSIANLQSLDKGRPKRAADESFVADRVSDAIWAYGWNLQKQSAWQNLQLDIHELYSEINQPLALFGKDLFGGTVPGEVEQDLAKMRLKLIRFGRQWSLWADWYYAVMFPLHRGEFFHEMEENIADRKTAFWSDDPNEVIDNITRITGWPQGVIAAEELPRAQDRSDISNSALTEKELTQYVSKNSAGLLQTLSGLMSLVELERAKVAEELPNSSERKEEVAIQLEWFDRLISGLHEVRSSLINSPPEETARKIDSITGRLQNWYGEQADWAQKSIRLTAVGSTALGLISLGMPPWLSVVVPGMFFAKKEIQEVRDAVRSE